jgi:tellurite resistance protein TerC
MQEPSQNNNGRKSAYEHARTVARTIIGFSVLGVGIIMIVTPGPAVVVIPVGLAILATEYAWARQEKARQRTFREGRQTINTKAATKIAAFI